MVIEALQVLVFALMVPCSTVSRGDQPLLPLLLLSKDGLHSRSQHLTCWRQSYKILTCGAVREGSGPQPTAFARCREVVADAPAQCRVAVSMA
jgi:hypothetical protein